MKSMTPLLLGGATAAFVAFLLGIAAGASGQQPGFIGIAVGVAMGAVVMLVLNNLSGNRKSVQADAESRRRALAFEVAPDKAALYLVRTGFVGKAAGMNVSVDGKEVVQLKSPRFARIDVAPGPHKLSAAFGGGLAAQTRASELDFTALAGEAVVIKLSMGLGAMKNPIQVDRVGPDVVRGQLGGMQMVKADA